MCEEREEGDEMRGESKDARRFRDCGLMHGRGDLTLATDIENKEF